MIASGVFRMDKLKGPSRVLFASRHNKRTIQAERGAGGHIDAERIELNFVLHGPANPEAVAQLARDRMANAGVKALRSGAVRALEMIFSLPANTDVPLELFFRDCLNWAAENFGGIENVLSADVHRDEAAPHMHVLILPLVNGRMNGSAMFGNKPRLQALQAGFHDAVAARYGLVRPLPRLAPKVREKTALAVVQRLRETGDPAQSSAVWAAVRDAVERDPMPFAELLAIAAVMPPAKRMRTMAEIFTSPGKGGDRRRPIGQQARPIGLEFPEPLKASLSCVGAGSTASSDRAAPALIDRDDDHRAENVPFVGEDGGRVVDRTDCDFGGWGDDARPESIY
jgi:hypothetical protein